MNKRFIRTVPGSHSTALGRLPSEQEDMPVISTFYGISILMFYFDDKRHYRPHIHAQYGGFEAVISINEGDVLER